MDRVHPRSSFQSSAPRFRIRCTPAPGPAPFAPRGLRRAHTNRDGFPRRARQGRKGRSGVEAEGRQGEEKETEPPGRGGELRAGRRRRRRGGRRTKRTEKEEMKKEGRETAKKRRNGGFLIFQNNLLEKIADLSK